MNGEHHEPRAPEAQKHREDGFVRSLLDTLFETAPIGLAVWDRDLRCARINATLAQMNGLSPEAHLGKRPSELLPDIEEVEAIEALFRRILETGEPALDVPVSGETPAEPGRMRHWIESFYPIRAGGEIVAVGVVAREVTDTREFDAFHRHVLGVVGHDLRNPLSAIGMSVSLLESRAADQATQRHLERIQSNVGKMDRIIGDLLDYSVAREGHGVPITRTDTDLAVLCRAVVDDLSVSYPEHEIVYRSEGDGRGRWDAARLTQMIENLLGNAFKHGAPNAPVTLRWQGSGDDVILEVANAGPPIPHDELHTIFDPFRRGEGGSKGHGLGLFIVREIVRSHGGTVTVRSSAAEGTLFSVLLPRR